MKRIACLMAALLALWACGCGAVQRQQEEEGLRLYCAADLDSAPGGDAITSVTIPWDALSGKDRQAQARAVVELLLHGGEDKAFVSPIPAGTELLNCELFGSTVWVDFSAAYGQLSGMNLTIADYCVTLSLTQIPDIYAARITVEGQELAYRDTNLFLAGDVLLTSTEDVVRTLAVRLYFPDGNGGLTPEDRLLTLYEGHSRVGVVTDALLAGPESERLFPLLPEDFAVVSVRLDGGTCYLNLPGEDEALLPEETEDQQLLLEGLVRSLCSVEGVSALQILVDGEYQSSFGALDISGPWGPAGLQTAPTAESAQG